MDPLVTLPLVGASLKVIVLASRDLSTLIQKYKTADQRVKLVLARLNTIHATLLQLDSWVVKQQTLAAKLASDLDLAVRSCELVVEDIQKRIDVFKSTERAKGKIRYIWNEPEFLHCQQSLDSQIAALALFMNVIIL